MSSVTELLEKMRSGELGGVSQFKLRDENIQFKGRLRGLPMLKRENKKKSKLLFKLELALPFNPLTGDVDETYNPNTKYRPLKSVRTVSLALKAICNESEEVKAKYMKRAGMEAWDTSDLTKLTSEDRTALKKYKVPRIFTVPIVHINIPALTGNDYGRDYAIKVDRDPENDMIIGEWPAPLKINKLYSDMTYEEKTALEKRVKDGFEDLTDKELEEKIKAMYSLIPVSSDYPANYVIAYELPLDTKFALKDDVILNEFDRDLAYKHVVLIKRTAEILAAFESYQNGSFQMVDVYDEYWEYDMRCPTDAPDAKTIGKETRYEKAMIQIKDMKGYAKFEEAMYALEDEFDDLEKIFMKSVRLTKYDESVESKLLDSAKTVLSLENPFLTEKVIKSNADIISLIFGDKGDDIIAEAEAGIKTEGELDEKQAGKLGKEYNISDITGAEDDSDEVTPTDKNAIKTEEVELS